MGTTAGAVHAMFPECTATKPDLGSSIDWLSREEASEVCMGSLCSNLQLALQVGDPALHEVHIVQEHPATLLGILVQDGLCRAFLTLHHTARQSAFANTA